MMILHVHSLWKSALSSCGKWSAQRTLVTIISVNTTWHNRADRPARVSELEITPAMIEAGMEILGPVANPWREPADDEIAEALALAYRASIFVATSMQLA